MLKHAGACLRELVRSRLGEDTVPDPTFRKAAAVELVRRRREERAQDIAFGARPFILCGLPIRRLPPGVLKYARRNGRFFLEVIGHPDYGVPFGQDRLIPLWVATQVIRYQRPTVEFDSAGEILRDLGLPQNGAHYRRLADAFRRVFGSTIIFGTEAEGRRAEVWDCSRVHFFDRVRLWFRNDTIDPRGRRNLLTISESFWEELREHPVPVDADVVRALANNPGCLDLYTWLSWRCFVARRQERIPLFGEFGLQGQLGVQEYGRDRKFRERLRRWLELVKLYWPECPAALSPDGIGLEVSPAIAVAGR